MKGADVPKAPEPAPAAKAETPEPVEPPAPPTPARPVEPSPPIVERPEPVAPPRAAPPPAPATPPQVAAVRPAPEAPPVDIRSALRPGAGAGSARGSGRGGIEGEPIPLDSTDARFNDYLERLRRKIKSNWGFPCVEEEGTRSCQYRTAYLVVEFGILRDGRVQFVDVLTPSGYAIYDDYAVNAIKFSSPFPPVPAALLLAMRQGSTGIAIQARFNYIVDTSLTNLLR